MSKLFGWINPVPANKFMLKVNNKNPKIGCEKSLKLKIETPERGQ